MKKYILVSSLLVLAISTHTLPVYAFGGMGGGMGMKEGSAGFGKSKEGKLNAHKQQEMTQLGIPPEMAAAFVPKLANSSAMRKYGLLLTGLVPLYPSTHDCPKVGSEFADPYRTDGSRRARKYFAGRHGGMDIPQPKGAPLLAMADGKILLRHEGNEGGIGGKGIWLLHSPEQSGTGKWIFIEYKHLDELPDLEEGDPVKIGQYVGDTGNSGTTGGYYGAEGFYHLHMTAYWSDSEEFTFNKTLIPKQGQWLDPIALFSNKTVDSQQAVDLSSEEKRIRINFKSTDGTVHPADSKIIWPYACTPK